MSALGAQTIRDLTLDPQQAVELPVSREITTVMFPGAITAVAGADMLIDAGREAVEVEEGAPSPFSRHARARLKFHSRAECAAGGHGTVDGDIRRFGLCD